MFDRDFQGHAIKIEFFHYHGWIPWPRKHTSEKYFQKIRTGRQMSRGWYPPPWAFSVGEIPWASKGLKQCYFQVSPGGNLPPPPRIQNFPQKKLKKQYFHHNNVNPPPPPDMWFPPRTRSLELTLGLKPRSAKHRVSSIESERLSIESENLRMNSNFTNFHRSQRKWKNEVDLTFPLASVKVGKNRFYARVSGSILDIRTKVILISQKHYVVHIS